MELAKLQTLLRKASEINKEGIYQAGFRYTNTFGKESLAFDIYKKDENLYHTHVMGNDELENLIVNIDSKLNTKSKWEVYYYDDILQIQKYYPNEYLASAAAFKYKQKYNIDVRIKELF